VVSRALRDAGFEVIYTGLHQTPEQIVAAAIQEDVQVVGLSCLSGAHMTLFPKVARMLSDQGANDILVVGGGIIPEEDEAALKEAGISMVWGPGTRTEDIIQFIKNNAPSRE